MSDAFISYSRRDKDFVRRLHDHLKAQNRDIWVDWDDIPPASDWRAYIKTGIEEANAVIFIISPDSARSKECRVEVDLALESGKRFIPVMRRVVEDEADKSLMHPSINSHNWVFLRDEDSFDEGIQKLLLAMDTDLEYVREHTRLLVRAREWEQNQHDGSLTLRGSDLAEAESWLASGVGKQPAPTPLQTHYIKISRQAETARSRRLLAGAAAAVVISVALAVMAFIQWQNAANNLELANVRGTEVRFQAATSDSNAIIAEQNAVTAIVAQGLAEDQRATAYARGTDVANSAGTAVAAQGEAERQALIARGAALASQAQLQVEEGRPELGLLLALEVLENYPYTSQAEFALSSAVQKIRPSEIFPAMGELYTTVALSPDGKHMLVPNPDNSVTLWDIDTSQPVWELTGHSATVTGVSWSPDGAYAATVSAFEGTVVIWDVATGEPQAQFDGYAAVWSPDSTRILTQLDETYVAWEAATGEQLINVNASSAPSITPPMDWSPDSRFIAAGDINGAVKIWDAANGELIYTLEAHQSPISAVSWSPDGTRLFTASGDLEGDPYQPGDASVRLWDMRTGDLLWAYRDLPVAIIRAQWNPAGERLMTISLDFNVRLWDAELGEPTLYLPGYEADWSEDGQSVVTSSFFEGSARVWDSLTGIEQAVLSGQTQGIPYLDWSADGRRIATASEDGTVRVWDMLAQTELLSIESPAGANWWPNGELIYSANEDGTTTIGFVETGEITSIANQIITISPDSSRALVWVEGAEMTVVEIETGSRLVTLSLPQGRQPTQGDWSPDGNHIVVADERDSLYTWDAATGQPGRQYEGSIGLWSADSSRLLTLSLVGNQGDNTATIWDAASGQALHQFGIADTALVIGGWKPDGTQIALIFQSNDGLTIHIYDANSGELIDTFPGIGMDWSPDGGRFVTVNRNGTLSIRDTETQELLATVADPGNSFAFVEWSPDGHSLLTLLTNDTSKVWQTWDSLEALQSFARECCVARALTPAERAQYGLPPAE